MKAIVYERYGPPEQVAEAHRVSTQDTRKETL